MTATTSFIDEWALVGTGRLPNKTRTIPQPRLRGKMMSKPKQSVLAEFLSVTAKDKVMLRGPYEAKSTPGAFSKTVAKLTERKLGVIELPKKT